MRSESLQNKGIVSKKRRDGKVRSHPVGSAKSSIERRRRRSRSPKHIGNLAELDFMLQAASRGFPVGKPFGDNEPYDVWVDARTHIWRVQVKTATRDHAGYFKVGAFWHGSRGHVFAYTPAHIDFLAAYVRPGKIWYIVPVRSIDGRISFNLYPFGARRRAGQFEKYREAWHLLWRGRRAREKPEGFRALVTPKLGRGGR